MRLYPSSEFLCIWLVVKPVVDVKFADNRKNPKY